MKTVGYAIFLLFSLQLYAQSGFEIKTGWNLSNFLNVQTGTKIGVIFGINKEWEIQSNHSISAGFLYTTRGGTLKNKTFGNLPLDHWIDQIYAYDIHCSIGFIDIPVVFHTYKTITTDTKIHLFAGPSLSIAIHDNSFISNKKIRYKRSDYQPEEWQNLSLNYFTNLVHDSIYNSSGFTLNFGIGIKRSSYIMELNYSLSLFEVESVQWINISEKNIQSVNFILGINVK